MAEIQVLVPTGTVITATGSGALAVPCVPGATIAAYVTASAVSGTTPSATFALQGSADGVNWVTLASAAALTAAGTALVSTTIPAAVLRLAWTVTGTTPSFTVGAVAVGQVARGTD